MQLCVTGFFKIIFASKIEKILEKWTKNSFFEFIEKFDH